MALLLLIQRYINIQIICPGQNAEKFKTLKFLIPNKDYSIKIIDSLAFLKSKLEDLSNDLDNDLKIITKNHFQDKFQMVDNKFENFPYNYVNKNNNVNKNKELSDKKYFYNMLKLKDIDNEEYKIVKRIL